MASSQCSGNLLARLTPEIHVHKPANPRPMLEQWLQTFMPNQKEFIEDRLDPILFLLKAQVHIHLFRALVHLWNIEEAAFCFGEHVLSPTIKEYTRLLQAPPTSGGINIPQLNKGPVNMFSTFLGIKKAEISKALKSCNPSSIRLCDLFNWFGSTSSFRDNRPVFCGGIEAWEHNRVNTFIVVVFGSILFPNRDWFIHYRVVELVDQFLAGKSYIPALLEEQNRSLTHLKRRGHGKFKANMALLTIWFISHTKDYGNVLSPVQHIRDSYDLILNFNERVQLEDLPKTDELVHLLQGLEAHAFLWVARWFHAHAAITGCQEYAAVPLIGLTGCTGYYPARVIRQYGALQDVTSRPSLEEISIDYEDPDVLLAQKEGRLRMILSKWAIREIKPIYVIEPINPEVKKYRATKEYILSQRAKVDGTEFQAPEVFSRPPTLPNSEIEAYMELTNARVEVRFQEMKKREQEMEEELLRSRLKIQNLEDQLRVAKRTIEELKDRLVCPSKIRRLV